jgi:predicted nuclease of predicted toxin-antitoxin system
LIDFDDFQIWNFAKKNEFTVVSMDSDFNDLMSVYGPPPKLIWLRFGNKGTKEIAHILDSIYDDLVAFHENNELGVFEVFLTSKT